MAGLLGDWSDPFPSDPTGLMAAARAARLLGWDDAPVEPIVLHQRAGLVVRVGELVLKVHPIGTVPAELRARLHMASTAGSFLAPLRREPEVLVGRLVSVWPYGVPVHPDRPADAPFLYAAALLARLHALKPSVPGLPRHGAVKRVARALARTKTLSSQATAAARRAVQDAATTLPAWARDPQAGDPCDRPQCLVHGDWHFGQMVQVRSPAAGGTAVGVGEDNQVSGDDWGRHRTPPAPDHAGWRLIDIDDLGVGDPAWDLAWPASWFAVGLLGAPEWAGLLAAYASAGGPALAADADVWVVLDPFARAATVHRAAAALARADEEGRVLDEAEQAFVEGCVRMAAHHRNAAPHHRNLVPPA